MTDKHYVYAAVLVVTFASVACRADSFTVVLLPDTQKYAESYEDIYMSQTQWIANNADAKNIVFVSHLGDIVENGGYDTYSTANTAEWQIADNAMSQLDGVVPYGMTIGNHDFDNWYQPGAGSQNYLNHFAPSRYENESWWGGASPDGLSSYQYFTGSDGRQYMIMHLKPDVPGETMAWAQQVLAANSTVPTMISTHIYMKESGRTKFSYMDFYDPSWGGNSGDEIFEKLTAENPQIFMINCGHVSAERFDISVNDEGYEVYELLQDYQNREDGGQGFLRLLEFDLDENMIHVQTYSPWLDEYETDADSQFDIAVDFDTRFSVPEPATIAFMLTGFAGASKRRRR